MKVEMNVRIELPGGDDDLVLWVDFAGSPIPAAGDAVSFEHTCFEVDRVQYAFAAEGLLGEGPDVWLYCVQGDVEAAMGHTADYYRTALSKFAAISWEA